MGYGIDGANGVGEAAKGRADLSGVNLLDVIGLDTRLRWVAKTCGDEYAGPCPFCGGHDRFRVQPAVEGRGRWWCRQCSEGERWHDAIDYVRRRHGLGYRDACAWLAIDAHPERAPLPPTPPAATEPPSAEWQQAAHALLADTFDALYSNSERPFQWLLERGLTEATIAQAVMGYNPEERWMERADWGLPPLVDRQGRPQRVWLPRGIVIPWFIGRGDAEAIWKLYIRRPLTPAQRQAGQKPYIQLPGGSNGLYNAHNITGSTPVMLVEGVFDCLAVRQEVGDLVVPVATGTTGARRVRWIAQLAAAPQALVSYDNDAAGERASRYWLDVLAPHAHRWRPYWDDPAAMLQAGDDLRGWVEHGLSQVQIAEQRRQEKEKGDPTRHVAGRAVEGATDGATLSIVW